MNSDTSPTTITVPEFVRRALKKYKTPGKTYGDVILEFIEEYPSAEFLAEMERRLREEKRYPMEQVLREAGLE
ncbi:MAG: hypothetical protein L3K13_01210 [Thermoplasmata archaeon]|nr:hypothetical protein [Thermoplasmata archaeon]